jgi:hypothetical protein
VTVKRIRFRSLVSILPLTALLASSAVSAIGQTARAPQTNARKQKTVVARGHLIGRRTFQQVVTWKTGFGRDTTAHLAIETTGTTPRSLWQAEERLEASDINSVRVADIDGDGKLEIIGLWAQGARSGTRLRIFHWDRGAQTFVELQPRSERDQDGITGVHRYRLQAHGARQRIIVFGGRQGDSPVDAADEFEVRGSEIVRVGGGASVAPEAESGIQGEAVISPAGPGPQRQGQSGSAPYQTTLVVVHTADGREVARVQTGSDGRFRVSLPPGEYTIGSSPDQQRRRFERGEEQTVKVLPGQFTTVTMRFDSGMR